MKAVSDLVRALIGLRERDRERYVEAVERILGQTIDAGVCLVLSPDSAETEDVDQESASSEGGIALVAAPEMDPRLPDEARLRLIGRRPIIRLPIRSDGASGSLLGHLYAGRPAALASIAADVDVLEHAAALIGVRLREMNLRESHARLRATVARHAALSDEPRPGAQSTRRSNAASLTRVGRILTASVLESLDSTLDAVIELIGDVLETRLVSIWLTGQADDIGAMFNFRRGNRAREDWAVAHELQLDEFTSEARDLRRPLFTPDFHGEPRIRASVKVWMPRVVASLSVPLFDDEGTHLGFLFAHWHHGRDLLDEDLIAVDALGRQAAIAIQVARLIDANRDAHARLDAVLDVSPDAMLVVGDGEQIERLNPAAASFLGLESGVAWTASDVATQARAAGLLGDAFHRAMEGVSWRGDAPVRGRDEVLRQCDVVYAPVPTDGQAPTVLITWRDLTEVREQTERRAQLDATVATANLIADRLNNRLAIVSTCAELLIAQTTGVDRQYARRVLDATLAAGQVLSDLTVALVSSERASGSA